MDDLRSLDCQGVAGSLYEGGDCQGLWGLMPPCFSSPMPWPGRGILLIVFGFDLLDAPAGHAVDLADLVQGLELAVGQAEPHGDDPRFLFGERVEDRAELLLEQGEADRLAGLDGLGVLDQVAELAGYIKNSGYLSRNILTEIASSDSHNSFIPLIYLLATLPLLAQW